MGLQINFPAAIGFVANLITIVLTDEALLEAGQLVNAPKDIQVGSIGGHPLMLRGELYLGGVATVAQGQAAPAVAVATPPIDLPDTTAIPPVSVPHPTDTTVKGPESAPTASNAVAATESAVGTGWHPSGAAT